MGQACIAGSRLFVSRAVYEPFMEKLTALTQQLIIGDPRQERVHVGPLISPEHRESVIRYVNQAIAEGGTIRLGGAIPKTLTYKQGIIIYQPLLKG